MWDLIASGPDHCLSFYFEFLQVLGIRHENKKYPSSVHALPIFVSFIKTEL